MSYLPKKGSLRDRVCKVLAERGPMAMHEITKVFIGERNHTISSAVFQLKFHKALVEDNGVYELSDFVRPHYGLTEAGKVPAPKAKDESLVPPRDATQFNKPWSGKFSLSNAPRREPIRDDVSFKTGSVGFPVGLYA